MVKENTPPFKYWPIINRSKLEMPDNARIAVWFGLNIESYEVDKPSTSIFHGTAMLSPDPLNYGWRDYGVRVGIWRMMKLFDKYKIKPSCLINSDICINYPEIITEGNKRNWTWVAHGKNNSIFQANMTFEEEEKYLTEMLQTMQKHTGQMPKGWLGHALTETFNTPAILAKLELNYILDWCNDDQPYPLLKEIGKMIIVPYSIELNDIPVFVGEGASGEDFYQMLKDQFDLLYEEGIDQPGIMTVALHPFIIGQPFRIKYLEKFLCYIQEKRNVWLTTSDEIADWYFQHYYDEALEMTNR